MNDSIKTDEEIVLKHTESALEAGLALYQLRRAKAWENREFRNHGEYAESLGISRSRATQLEQAGRLHDEFERRWEGDEKLPENESVIRPLCRLVTFGKEALDDEGVEKAMEVWRKAVDDKEDSTRKLAERVREELGEGKCGTPLGELQVAETEPVMPECSVEPPPLRTPREMASHANQTLALLGRLKTSPIDAEVLDEVEKNLRWLKDALDVMDEAQRPEVDAA
jgi:hypothetical protein